MRHVSISVLAALLPAACCLVALAPSSANAQPEPTPLAEADLPIENLIDAPPRVYHLRLFALTEKPAPDGADGQTFSISPQEVGKLSVATRRWEGGEGLELIDRLDAHLGSRTVTRLAQSRPNPLLTPTRVRIESGEDQADGETAVIRAVLDGNRMEVDPPDPPDTPDTPDTPDEAAKTRRHDWPPGTLTLSALIRIAPLLPREPDTAFSVDGFVELFEFEPATPPAGDTFVIRTAGSQTLDIGRRTYRCTIFLLDLREAQQNVRLWVDREGVLRQFVVGQQLRATLGEPGPIQEDPIYNQLLEELGQ